MGYRRTFGIYIAVATEGLEIMKSIVCSIGIVLILGIFVGALAQSAPPTKSKTEAAKSDWVKVEEDIDRNPFYVDKESISRIMDVVIFKLKYTKRGTTWHLLVIANCTADIFSYVSTAVQFAGGELTEVERRASEIQPITRDSVMNTLLNYTCLASIKPLTNPK